MKALKHIIEYSLVRFLELAFGLFPRSAAVKLGEGVGVFFSWLVPRRRRLVLDNLAQAFPAWPGEERRLVAGAVWKNLGRTAVEFLRLDEIKPDNQRDFLTVEGEEILRQSMRQKKGVILVGFHFTNWEVTGVGNQLLTRNLVAIARPIKNPRVEAWVQAKRAASGMKIILHRQAVRASLKWLKAGNTVGILADQNLYTGGVFTDFFGRPAATTTLPALLHERTGAPVLLTYTLREGEKFRLVYEGPLPLVSGSENEDRLQQNTRIINDRLQVVIRRHPENWFWVHNRWKRRPEPQEGAHEPAGRH